MKTVLIIYNPIAGKKKSKKFIPDIVELFAEHDCLCTVVPTRMPGDGTTLAKTYSCDYDMVVCLGGDGTFRNVVSGLAMADYAGEVGYIPTGTTNDFATTLGLANDIMEDAHMIATGKEYPVDIGKFDDTYFTYVASFGIFTRSSYETPQSVKNIFGHAAYVLNGITELTDIQAEHLIIQVDDGEVIEDDFMFGAVSNATHLGGILKIDPERVKMDDGEFELFLVRIPKTPLQLTTILNGINTQNYDNDMIYFRKGKKFSIKSEKPMDWSLDGEHKASDEEVTIQNLYQKLHIML